jgi:hypothetical protein
MVLAPIEFEPNPALSKLEKGLGEEFFEALRSNAGVTVASKAETEAALAGLKRLDFRDSNEAVAKLSERSATLYGMHVLVTLSSQRVDSKAQWVLALTGRVVRNDGKLMKDATVSLPKKKDSVQGLFRALTPRLFEELALGRLPTFKEAPPVETPSTAAPATSPLEAGRPPAMPPLLEAKGPEGTRFPFEAVGYAALGGGGAVALGGVIVAATAPTVRVDSDGNVYAEDKERYRTTQRQHDVGWGLIVGGAAVAVAGGALVLWGHLHDSKVKAAVVPTAGGAVLVAGGAF